MAAENYRAPSVAQSAELAEQQGVNGWDIAEKVRADLDRQSCPDAYMRIAVESVVKHLVATGKQQVGEVQGVELPPLPEAFEAEFTAPGMSPVSVYTAEQMQDYARAALAARQPGAQVPVELACVAETLAHGEGLWRTCSGCHESNEGVPTGPYSQIMKCNLGNGCGECGGIGAIWDDTDYQAWSDQMVQSLAAPPAQAASNGKLVAWWNGITPGYDGQGVPSIRWGSNAENSGHDIPLYDGYNPIHYQQPAQGIDLGQFRPFVQAERAHLSGRIERCDAIGSADRLEALQAKARECDRLLALIDGQRDAAPEPTNG